MELTEPLRFDHADRRDIYEYVESRGTVSADQTRRALGMEHRPFGHHLIILQRKGMIQRTDDELRIAYEDSETKSYETEEAAFTIRQARQEDLDGLVGAIRAAIGSGEYVDAETVADIVDSEGVIMRHNDVESRTFFVATVGGDVVGWVHLERPETAKLSHTAELTVGVLDQYRDGGLGSTLMERGLDWARSAGVRKVYQNLPETNEPAISFLEANGWTTESTRDGHYRVDDELVDEVQLAVWLDE